MEDNDHNNSDTNVVVIDLKDEYNNRDKSNTVAYKKKENGNDNGAVDMTDSKKEDDKKERLEKVGYVKLFRYANFFDYTCMVIGTIAAMVHGASMPALFIIFGDITDPFVEFGKLANHPNFTGCITDVGNKGTISPMPLDINYFIMWFCIIAAITWVSGTIQMHLWMLVAVRLGHKIKLQFMKSILRQDMSYFDMHSMGEMNTRLAEDVQKVQDGIGDKLAVFICMMARCIAGIVIGFVYAWQLTLVILAVTPLMALSAGLMMKIATAFTQRELDAYAKAGAIAEEVLSSMRTVVAFGGEEKEINRYKVHLKEATKFGITKGVAAGASLGFVMFVLFSVYGLSFWYGSTLVLDYTPPKLSVGGLLTCFFAVFIAAFSLGQGLSSMEYFSSAMGAGFKVFNLIDREPPIDSFSTAGHKPDVCTGKLELKNINFTYPSRKDVQVLKEVSFVAEPGKTIALCGQSGCGKSTCVQLIQRFYDPQEGEILFDGHDIRSLNVKWLRENIGVVSQEPVLFDDTIVENIRYGREGVTDEEVFKAAKEANAYDFIMKLPQKFKTMVGEGGTQMSGGQKQRIAIARAIIRNPKVLLLDEATSALDTESESVVQAALEKASKGRTTIVIAHRLSTIRNADTIIGFYEGQIMEQGSHSKLLELDNGVYKNLVEMQNVKHVDDDAEEKQVERKISKNRMSSKKSSTKRHRVLSQSSTINDKDEDKESEENVDDLPDVSWFRVMKLNLPELPFILFGTLMSLISGGIQPTYAIMFANFLGAFAILDPVKQKEEIRLYCLLFFGLGCIILVSNLLQAACFAKSGESLTERIRGMCFTHLMKQDMSYFDDYNNSTGALTTRLAVDASRIQGMAGIRLGLTAANIGALVVGLAIAFVYSWKLTLLMIAFLPFMILGGYLQMQMLTGKGTSESKSFEKSGQIATEATMSIKTVASLTREEKFLQRYKDALSLPYSKMKRKAFFYGLTFGYSQSVLNFAFAGVFRFGAYLVEVDCLPFDDMFRVLMAVMMAAMIAGQSSSMAPDYAQAMLSSKRVFKLLDRDTLIDSSSDEGEKPTKYDGSLTLNSCVFTYPSRPDTKVLNGLSVAVNPGETLALVGQSGCGKSTVIQLILRYYDPDEGQVQMDKAKNTLTNIKWMRQQLGIVSQEPVLFDASIADNIRYGDNTREISDEEIIVAARSANIHDFIESLPNKYATNVGGKGTQLSGGQKQRVAIARALVRQPKVLLLDEATSALDTESEKVVQAALDAAQEGRTCIMIAHRLSTVKNADNIAVIEHGKVAEFGKHTELLNKRGIYYNLVNAQLNQQ